MEPGEIEGDPDRLGHGTQNQSPLRCLEFRGCRLDLQQASARHVVHLRQVDDDPVVAPADRVVYSRAEDAGRRMAEPPGRPEDQRAPASFGRDAKRPFQTLPSLAAHQTEPKECPF